MRRSSLTVDACACRGALRGARGEAVLRRARRVHHVGADPGARAGRGGGDRDRPHDDGRDEPSRRRRPERFAAISRCRCRTTSSTAPTRRSRRRARSRSGLADYLERNRAVLDEGERGVHGRARVVRRGRRRRSRGGCSDRASRSWACSATWSRTGRRSSSAAGRRYFGAWLATGAARARRRASTSLRRSSRRRGG